MFHENWFEDSQIKNLVRAVRSVKDVKGKLIEIGCWEGRSTIAIANECFPENLDAVDTWKGNIDENPVHESVIIASQRDVYQEFNDNVRSMTKGNVTPYRQDCFEYLNMLKEPVKFCNIDASHDYRSVKRTIEALLPKLANNAILCGDDYYTANIYRNDLDGGVQRAVIEMCPFHSSGNFWVYRHSAVNRFVLKFATARRLIALIRTNIHKAKAMSSSLRRGINTSK